MSQRIPALALALFLALAAFPGAAPAYDLPQVCIDAHKLQHTPSPDQDRVITLYTECLKGDLSPKNRAVALLNRGNAKFRQGSFDAAFSDYTASISIHPLAKAHNSRGVVKKRKGDVDGALEDYARALELDSKYFEAYYNRGIAKKSIGDLEGAVADYTRSIECNPRHAKSYGNRAFVYQALGRIDQAKADAARARELDPEVKAPTF